MDEIIRTAKTMIGLGEHDLLETGLKEMLQEAEFYANRCGGSIRSRQVIASIIVAWDHS